MPSQIWKFSQFDHKQKREDIQALPLDDLPCVTMNEGGGDKLGFRRVQLLEGKSAGVEVVRLKAGDSQVDVCLTRGMGILQAVRNGVRFGWDSPIGAPVHPMWVDIAEPSGLGWLDGFTEMTVRCGLESNGAPEHSADGVLQCPLHGRIANLPAENVSVELDPDAKTISIEGDVLEARFHFRKLRLRSKISVSLDSNEIILEDTVTNLFGAPSEFQMLYHNNFGTPLLGKGSRLIAPASKVVPRNAHAAEGLNSWDTFEEPTAGYTEQVYFLELIGNEQGRTKVLLQDLAGDRGVSVQHDVRQLPCFSVWKNTVPMENGYVTGLEPATNFPNPRSFEKKHGREVSLAAGESVTMRLAIGMLTESKEVDAARAEIDELLAGSSIKQELHESALEDWCAP